jgi:hypothetical protein
MPSIKIKSNINEVVGGSMEYLQTTISYPVSPQIKNEIGWTIATIANVSLGQYIDREARRSPSSFHHVYEWGRIGSPNYRLWKTSPKYINNMINISTEFLPSKSFVPNKSGSSRKHKFVFKAKVMEAGKPIKIRAKNASALFFIGKSGPIFIKPSRTVVVTTPGGKRVAGSFSKALLKYQVSPRLQTELNTIGFFRKIEEAIARAARSMPPLQGKPSKMYLRSVAQLNTSKHINQVLRQYRYGGAVING